MIHTSVCMITYNKLPFLRRAIPAIVNTLSPALESELIVLDNGSDDGTSVYLRTLRFVLPPYVNYRACREPKNIGLNAYKVVTELASGEIIITADDDILKVHSHGWQLTFEKILKAKFSGKRFGYVGSTAINENGGMPDEIWGVAKLGDTLTVNVCAVGGWFSATTREAMNTVGGFHSGKPEMFLEDADYQRRLWAEGYICGITPNVEVFHARAPEYYTRYGRENTYLEKERLAREVGITLEPLT